MTPAKLKKKKTTTFDNEIKDTFYVRFLNRNEKNVMFSVIIFLLISTISVTLLRACNGEAILVSLMYRMLKFPGIIVHRASNRKVQRIPLKIRFAFCRT